MIKLVSLFTAGNRLQRGGSRCKDILIRLVLELAQHQLKDCRLVYNGAIVAVLKSLGILYSVESGQPTNLT